MIRRWGAWIALGVVVVVALTVVLWPNGSQSPAARAHDLETELKCPECQGLSVADSQAPTSRAIRADIKRRIKAGQSDAEIRGEDPKLNHYPNGHTLDFQSVDGIRCRAGTILNHFHSRTFSDEY